MGMAVATAMNPMTWVQPRVEVSANGGVVPEPPGPSIAISSPYYVGAVAGFRWRQDDVSGPFSLVVLAEGYVPIARFDGIEGSPFCPDAPASAVFAHGDRYSAYLLATHEGREVKSPLTTFVWECP